MWRFTQCHLSGLSPSASFSENFRAFEHTITRFTTTLLPLHQLGATMPDDKYSLFVIHSLAHASMITLHQPFMTDQISRESTLRAARSVTVVAKHISDADFDYLDPLIGVRNASSSWHCSGLTCCLALLGPSSPDSCYGACFIASDVVTTSIVRNPWRVGNPALLDVQT